MEFLHKSLQSASRWFTTTTGAFFLLILFFAFFTRFWRLDYPQAYYFDEVYHVVTSKLIATNDPSAYEWWHAPPEPGTAIDWLHPPLAKLMQGASIFLLGNNSFAWRFSSALLGTLTVGLTYVFARSVKLSEKTSLLAMFLISLDGLSLTLSRITMNDAHVSFFILLASWLYVRWKKQPSFQNGVLTALATGLACASKWSGIFLIGFFFLDALRENLSLQKDKASLSQYFRLGILCFLIVPFVYLASYGQMFLQGKDWQHLKDLHQQIIWYQTNLKATHPYQSTPVEWVLALRPLYAYTEPSPEGKMANIYFSANPALAWTGLIVILALATNLVAQMMQKASVLRKALTLPVEKSGSYLQRNWKLAEQNHAVQTGFFVTFLAYLSTWIVWLQSPRIMFFYHYTPAMPFFCVITAMGLMELWNKGGLLKGISLALIATIGLTFLIFFPNWTALTVSVEPFAKIYFALSSWR